MNNQDDRISELPCEILVNVLSLLPLKEAAGTSVLSRRWRHVWESTMKLNFDASNYVAGTKNFGVCFSVLIRIFHKKMPSPHMVLILLFASNWKS